MSKKYEFTGRTRNWCGTPLLQIRAIRAFANVGEGDIGGWIETDDNLSQEDDAWVGGDAKVFGCAKVRGKALINGSAQVYGEARVGGNAKVCGEARVHEYARVGGDANVLDNALVCGNANVSDYALINGDSTIGGYAKVGGNAHVCGEALVGGNAKVSDYALINGDSVVCGNAQVGGYAQVGGDAQIGGDALVLSSDDYVVFKNCWSSRRLFTFTRSNRMWRVGCFYGTGEELVAKAYKDSDRSGRCYEAIVKAMETIEEAMS